MAKLLTATEAYLAGRVDIRTAFTEAGLTSFDIEDKAQYEAVNQSILDLWKRRIDSGQLPDPTEPGNITLQGERVI